MRPGAGRKKGALNIKTVMEVEARDILVNRLLTQWQAVADISLDIALGKIVCVRIEGKRKHVYTRPPDERMLQFIIETVIGKPKQPVSGSINFPELQQLSADIRSILTNKGKVDD